MGKYQEDNCSIKKNIPVTVLSMCYNKASTIARLYESLRKQTCYSFEWVIINDGSTDNVGEIVKSFKDDLFSIRFYDKPNEGAGRTWNRGIQLSGGELIFRVDPDDYVLPDAIKLILDNRHYLEEDDTLCGLVFLSVFDDGAIVGHHPYKEDTRSNFYDYRIYDKAEGDRAEVVKRSVFLEFPWPTFEDEKFCLESLMWIPMAQKYDALYINHPIYVREYTTNSITGDGFKVYQRNPVGEMHVQLLTIDVCSKKRKTLYLYKLMLKSCSRYFRVSYYSKIPRKKVFEMMPFPWNIIGCPLGFLMYSMDVLFPGLLSSLKRRLCIKKNENTSDKRIKKV